MKSKNKRWVNAAIAGLFAAQGVAIATNATAYAEGKSCYGVNGCKGKGECGSKGSACAGSNACKGKGFITLSEEECLKQGGSLTPIEAKAPQDKSAPTKK